MRLECKADSRSWAEVKDVWTRNDLKRYNELLGADDLDGLHDFYTQAVQDCQVVDANGKEYKGVAQVFEADDLGDLDAAVAWFWARLPWLAYVERQKLGEARKAS